MDGQTNWQNDCEECIHAKWSYELIHTGGRMAHRSRFVSGCELKKDPYDCDDYEAKEDKQ